MILAISTLLLFASQGLAQRDAVCLEDNGFFEDPEQCDAYYRCIDGNATWELCPDGLGFLFYPHYQSISPRCDFLIGVDCGDRQKLQPAQSSTNCERKYGIFTHASDCSRFWQCDNGESYEMQCPYTLAFNEKYATCDYFENVERCTPPEAPVVCPSLNFLERLFNPHPLLPDPNNCAQFYICMSGKFPRSQGCPPGTLYNSRARVCDDQDLVDCGDRPLPATEEETDYNSIRGGRSGSSQARSRSSGRSLESGNSEQAFKDPEQDLEKVSYAEADVDHRESQATKDNTRTYEDTRRFEDTRTYENTRGYDETTYEKPTTPEEVQTTAAPETESTKEPIVKKKPAKKLAILGKKEDPAEQKERNDDASSDDDSALISFNFGRTPSQDSRPQRELRVSADLV